RIKRRCGDVVVTGPEAKTDDFLRIGLAVYHAGAVARFRWFARKTSESEIHAVPENMHRRTLTGKAAAKLLKNVIDRHQHAMISFDIFLVVGFIFGIFGKRRF